MENVRKSRLTSLGHTNLLEIHLVLDTDSTKASEEVQVPFLQIALSTAAQCKTPLYLYKWK
jgi:hypothetical protein